MQAGEVMDRASETTRHAFTIDSSTVLVGTLAAALCVLCVAFHYEAMSLASIWIRRLVRIRRARIVLLILAMSAAHGIEVWAFGLTYWFLDLWPGLGHIEGDFSEGALAFVYFSVTTYSTLGFGDMVPYGPIRVLVGSEALLGLVLITWTASAAFLEMQSDWGEFRRNPRG